MTPNFICNFANSIADYVKAKGLVQPVLIARDTRVSGIIVEDIISGILLSRIKGGFMEFYQLLVFHVCLNWQLFPGIMITASHNPFLTMV